MKMICVLLVTVSLLSSCEFLKPPIPAPLREAFPYHATAESVGGLRRVVMMPLRDEIPGRRDTGNLQRSIQRALSHEHLFELVPVSEADLADTDFDSTRKEGTFKTEDLITLSRRFGAEGVIHGVLTHHQIYPQVVIGLRLTLLDCRTGQVPWATDVILDASTRVIKQDVHNYYDTIKWEDGSLLDHEKVLVSPRLFGEYAAARIAGTMTEALRVRPASKVEVIK